MRLAYADPPYLGCCNLYGHEHGDPLGRPFDGTGAKPDAFCEWVLDLLNVQAGDEFVDVFSGTGVMGRVAALRTEQSVSEEVA